jgi:hypothetical protein
MKRALLFLPFLCLVAWCTLSSCRKNLSYSKGNLTFSTDTVVFDTVFTTVGSTTKQFKLYNPSNKPLKIDQISLMGGDQSPFRINVDGVKGPLVSNLVVEAKDSLFVFVEVTLAVNNQTLPMVVEDSIQFTTNGVNQYVQLAVWGQDAYFHYKDLNEGIWPNDKPHVIYGYAAVDSSKTLEIQAGTQLFMHKNAILYVYKGCLKIQGLLNQEVVIQGDRLESMYDDVPGQYYGIYFHQALPSVIDYAIIKNGTAGVHLYSEDPSNVSYTLEMKNSRISNAARYGVFIYAGAKVKAENCIISKNQSHALLMLAGGDFNFNHCHLLGYGGSQVPAVGISNYFYNSLTGITTLGNIGEGTLSNSIVSGNLNNEIVVDTLSQGSTVNLNIHYSLIKHQEIPTAAYFSNILWNVDPLFIDVAEGDFTFSNASPLQGSGTPSTVITDILGNSRNNPPDLGAYELP